jgi:hypothetical protein
MSASQSTFGADGRKPLDQVVGHPHALDADSGPPALAGRKPRDSGGSHQPLDALAGDADPVRQAQLGVDPRRAVDAPVGLVDLLDLLGQPGVL